MNISGIQNLIWLGSLAAGAYLGYYLYEFKQNQLELQARVEDEVILAAVRDVEIPEAESHVEFDFPVVKRIFHDMNWTGVPPVKPVVVETPQDQPTETRATPVADLLDVLYVRAAMFDPAHSQTLVSYTDAALRRDGDAATLVIDDHLPDPYSNVFVKNITDAGVVFGFEDAEREPELVQPPKVKNGIQIVEAGADGALMPADTESFQVLPDAPSYNPKATISIGRNKYRVGTDDAERFATDYASIIAQVGHSRHRNPSTGQYDGIEIKSVPPNSIAAAHGVKSGDVIKSINGHPVSSVQEAIQFAKNNSEQYTTWEIVVENKGAERTMYYETPQD
jgi:hypothetical protein